MTPTEKSMIEELFARIRATGVAQRDTEADSLIAAEMARTPGAAYALAQTVLVQDHALREAHEQLQAAQQAAASASTGPAGGSFLDRFGLGSRGAVPRTGPADAAPQGYGQGSFNQAGSNQGGFGQGGYGQPGPTPQPQGGGFLRGAAQTAAGVAGGALLFEGVRSLFGGGLFGGGGGGFLGGGGSPFGGSSFAGPWGGGDTVVNETIINEGPQGDDRGGNDAFDSPSNLAGYDDGNDGGGWDDDGGDDSSFA